MFVPPQDRISGKKVNFMATCLCDAIFADAAKDAVKILRKYAEVAFVQDQTCCGQPAFNSGDFESARKVIRHTMGAFSANDYPIVVPAHPARRCCTTAQKSPFATLKQESVMKLTLLRDAYGSSATIW
ncbi:MAG: heterodisulfide reductase-related iron-sulfur binding cluster [Bacilli bacterium]